MTVQRSYAEMIGREGLILARYQFTVMNDCPHMPSDDKLQCQPTSNLKRLGFAVTRAPPLPLHSDRRGVNYVVHSSMLVAGVAFTGLDTKAA